jgi:trimeric autotransporter adhesin
LNNDYFDVEKSIDGSMFDRVATVDGHGTCTQRSDYDVRDSDPFDAVCYYRLKQVDLDGSFSYSNVVALKPVVQQVAVHVGPNPLVNTVDVSFADCNALKTITLFDPNGFPLRSVELSASQTRCEMDVSDMPPGTFVLKIKSGDSATRTMVLVKSM